MDTLIANFRKECERVQNGGNFQNTPMAFRVPEMNLIAVKADPKNLALCDDVNITPEIVNEAVSRDGYVLQYVPKKMRTREVCELAMKSNPLAFMFVPEEFVDKEVFRAALEKDGRRAIHHIPESALTPELCLLAAQSGAGMGDMPYKYWTRDVILAMAKKGNVTLEALGRFVMTKDFIRDREILIAASKGDIRNIEEFPKKLLDYDTCLEIVREADYKNKNPLLFIPKKYITEDMIRAILDNGGFPLVFDRISPRCILNLSMEIIRDAIRKEPKNIVDVPVKIRSEELAILALEQPVQEVPSDSFEIPLSLEWFPTSERTTAVCMAAIRSGRIDSLRSIPPKSRTKEMIRLIADVDGEKALESESVVEVGIVRIDELIQFVPPNILDREVYQAVLHGIESVAGNDPLLDRLVRKWQRKAEKAGLSFVDVRKVCNPGMSM